MATAQTPDEVDTRELFFPVLTVDTEGLSQKPIAPTATESQPANPTSPSADTDPGTGLGVDGETNIWLGRYSQRNFLGRIAFRTVVSLAWMVLAIVIWGGKQTDLSWVVWTGLAVVGLIWVALGVRMVQAHYSHFYRLSNRRLFVSTGIFHRRRDMMELLRVKDVFTRQQSLTERWLGLGTVVVVPNDRELPTFYLVGVDDPKAVMDLVWHQARKERDLKTVEVQNV